jgi:hypothetical protein
MKKFVALTLVSTVCLTPFSSQVAHATSQEDIQTAISNDLYG